MMSRVWSWVFGPATQVSHSEDVNSDIRRAFDGENGNARFTTIEHHNFIGECFVDGLMHKNIATRVTHEEVEPIIFAMH